MRTKLAVIALAAVALPAAQASAQQPDWSKIEIKAEKVAGNVYVLTGEGGFNGGNIGVAVGRDGVLLVDDKFEPLVPKIEAALRGITSLPVRFVLNTHYHGDHTHGNKVFGTKATVLAHDNVRTRIAADDRFDGRPGTRAPRQALPILTFDHSLRIHLDGEEIRGIHLPHGHTDGDTVVYFETSNVVHMGDDLFNGMYPFIDLEAGGSVKGYIAAVEEVLSEVPGDVRIIAGHGPLASRSDLEGYLAMIKETTAIVERGIAQGRTLDQLRADKVLAAFDARWGGGFMKTDVYLAQLFNSLKGIARNPS